MKTETGGFILIIVVIGVLAIAAGIVPKVEESPAPLGIAPQGVLPDETVDEELCTLNTVECEGETTTYKVTGFSSHECNTTWCNAHEGEPRGKKIAVNKKFGNVKQVYLPKYDKTYDVIGTTDWKTELDIWFGDEYDNALQFGVQYLEADLLY